MNRFQYLCTKVTQKALQHNFVLIVIYYIILEHTHRLTSWMYYTPHFSTQSPRTSTALDQRATGSFLYQFDFCSRRHFFTFSLTSSSIPNLFPRVASLRAPKRRKTEGAGYGMYSVCVGKNCSSECCVCFPLFQKCVVVRCVEGGRQQ